LRYKTIDRFNTVIANATQFIENENDNNKQQSGSASERFIFWTASINTVKKYPFFGSGSGDFRLELRRFTKEYPQYNVIADHYGTAHNIFFEWLALFGIVGFLALIISVFLLPLTKCWYFYCLYRVPATIIQKTYTHRLALILQSKFQLNRISYWTK
jgi:O-antigen ligase